MEVVDWIMDEVARERVDGERRPVAAATSTLPVLALDGIERVGQRVGGHHQLSRDHCRVLLAVPLGHGRRVLVPVRKQRVVFGEHQRQPLSEQPVDVAHMRAVLER